MSLIEYLEDLTWNCHQCPISPQPLESYRSMTPLSLDRSKTCVQQLPACMDRCRASPLVRLSFSPFQRHPALQEGESQLEIEVSAFHNSCWEDITPKWRQHVLRIREQGRAAMPTSDNWDLPQVSASAAPSTHPMFPKNITGRGFMPGLNHQKGCCWGWGGIVSMHLRHDCMHKRANLTVRGAMGGHWKEQIWVEGRSYFHCWAPFGQQQLDIYLHNWLHLLTQCHVWLGFHVNFSRQTHNPDSRRVTEFLS